MAIGDRYATATEYRAQRGTVANSDDAVIERALDAASFLINRSTARPLGFQKDAAGISRYYVGNGHRVLDINDHVSISAVAYDSARDDTYATTLAATDYEKLPLNAASRPVPEPYRQLRATEWGSLGIWPHGTKVRVTGVGGWNAVPAAVKAAAIELAALILIQSPRATSEMNEMGATVVRTSREAQGIIQNLVRAYRDPRSYI